MPQYFWQIRYIYLYFYVFYVLNVFYTPPQDSGRVLWFHVGVRVSVCPPMRLSVLLSYVHQYFRFQRINLVFMLILWRSGLRLLMGKHCQYLTQLSAHVTFVFSFLHNNISKYQWIFTKFGICIDIVKVWFEIANTQISLIFVGKKR